MILLRQCYKIFLGGITKNNTCCGHHNQLRKSCVLNLSCDQFNQLCLAEGKIAPGVFILPHEAKLVSVIISNEKIETSALVSA